MSTSSQNSQGVSLSEYEPRYQVGDLIRDGLGATCRITDIRRASHSDGYSDTEAVQEGFTTYEYRRVSDGYRSVSATRFMHELIDTGYLAWAYLGPELASETHSAAQDGAA